MENLNLLLKFLGLYGPLDNAFKERVFQAVFESLGFDRPAGLLTALHNPSDGGQRLGATSAGDSQRFNAGRNCSGIISAALHNAWGEEQWEQVANWIYSNYPPKSTGFLWLSHLLVSRRVGVPLLRGEHLAHARATAVG